MNFICYVDTRISGVPHMEVLPSDNLDQARAHALRLMKAHRQPLSARIYQGDSHLDTLLPPGPPDETS